MGVIRFCFILGLTFALAGCVSFPQTPDEFRATSAGTLDFDVDLPLHESYALVARNTIKCHQGNSSQMSMIQSSFVVMPTGETRVEGKMDASGSRAFVTVSYAGPTASGLLQVIDFVAVSNSESRITVHRLNDTRKWQTATAATQEWFFGGTKCYEMW